MIISIDAEKKKVIPFFFVKNKYFVSNILVLQNYIKEKLCKYVNLEAMLITFPQKKKKMTQEPPPFPLDILTSLV